MDKVKDLVGKFVKDKHGKVVMWQTPNLPIIIWVDASVLGAIARSGRIHRLADVIAFGALFTWAWLEIFKGSSYFRRSLGLVVMIIIILGRSAK